MKKIRSVIIYTATLGALVWSCSSPPYYPGGGRDLGPQGTPMNQDGGGMDTGVVDSGVDTGVKDTGVDSGDG